MSTMPAVGDVVEVTTVRRGKVTERTTSRRLIIRVGIDRLSIPWPPDSDTTVRVVKPPLPTTPESRVRTTDGVLWFLAPDDGCAGDDLWVPCTSDAACGGPVRAFTLNLATFTVEYDAGAGA